MDGEDQVGAVVHGHLGFHFQGLVDVAVVGVAVFAFDGEGGDAFVLGQVSRHVVLGAQGIGGADVHLGPAGFQGGGQHPRLGGDMETGGDPDPGQGFFPLEPLPDGIQDRHIPPGPLHPQAALVRQINIFYIVIHGSPHLDLALATCGWQVQTGEGPLSPAFSRSTSTLLIYSQVKSGSVRPKWP